MDGNSNRAMLPGIAFATNAGTGAPIALRPGEPGYYRVETTLSATELNRLYGVSQRQARAMLITLLRNASTLVQNHCPR